jgi:type II secretory pathway component PulJ
MYPGKTKRGYSLVELNTSVALVAILLASAAILLWSVTQYFRKSEARYLLQVQAAKTLSTISRELVQTNGTTVMVGPNGEWVSFASFRDLNGQNRRQLGALVWQSRAAFSLSADKQAIWERALIAQPSEQPPEAQSLDNLRQLATPNQRQIIGNHMEAIGFSLNSNRKTLDLSLRSQTKHWEKSYWVELKSSINFRND